MTRTFHRLTRSPTYLLAALAVLALPLAWAQSSSGGTTERYTITESDYTYKPDQMTWHVGDTVVLSAPSRS